MSDQPQHDHPLGDAAHDHEQQAQVLTLDEIMNQARLVERTAYIYLRGDLDDEVHQLTAELAQLVDENGELLDDGEDQSLGDANRAQQLFERLREVRAERDKSRRAVKFRQMPDDEFRVFERTHRDKDGGLKDRDDYYAKIIARCAIAPTMSEDDVRAMRKKLGAPQMTALGNAAYLACATGGLDIPKSPTFLAGLEQRLHDRS
ncbi:hypothetical protein [Nocardioides pakistanensis]